MSNDIYVLLSRNNVYIGTYNEEEYRIIMGEIDTDFYFLVIWNSTNVLKTNYYNATKIRQEIDKVLEEYRINKSIENLDIRRN